MSGGQDEVQLDIAEQNQTGNRIGKPIGSTGEHLTIEQREEKGRRHIVHQLRTIQERLTLLDRTAAAWIIEDAISEIETPKGFTSLCPPQPARHEK